MPLKGYKQTAEHRAKIKNGYNKECLKYLKTDYWLGKKFSEEHKRNLKNTFKKGQIPWNKGTHIYNGGGFKEGHNPWNKGKKGVQKWSIKRIKEKSISMSGKNNHNYRHGKCKDSKIHYNDLRYKLWRESVYERDNYICQNCFNRGGYIEAHHIKGWTHFPELRYELDNGLTLCKKCHKLTDNYRGKGIKKYRNTIA